MSNGKEGGNRKEQSWGNSALLGQQRQFGWNETNTAGGVEQSTSRVELPTPSHDYRLATMSVP